MKYCENYQNVKYKVSKYFWENGTNILAQSRVATDLQFVKNAMSLEYNKVKRNEMRYACTQKQEESKKTLGFREIE